MRSFASGVHEPMSSSVDGASERRWTQETSTNSENSMSMNFEDALPSVESFREKHDCTVSLKPLAGQYKTLEVRRPEELLCAG